MQNQQLPEPVTSSKFLSVHSVWNTIQGEGPLAGVPAVFIRLAGCNLQCRLCDTDYTSSRRLVLPRELAQDAIGSAGPAKLVVITGGEPFRQDISELVRRLVDHRMLVQIETNGTLPPTGYEAMLSSIPPHAHPTIVCSPKTSKVDPFFANNIGIHWKYAVACGKVDPCDGLPTGSLGMTARPFRPAKLDQVYVQPLDENDTDRNRINTMQAVQSCLKFGYRLCLQVHKFAGVQ